MNNLLFFDIAENLRLKNSPNKYLSDLSIYPISTLYDRTFRRGRVIINSKPFRLIIYDKYQELHSLKKSNE